MTHPTNEIQGDVVIRAWDAWMQREGARFVATTVRRDITLRVTHGSATCGNPSEIVRPGLVVIAPSAGPLGQNAVDVTVRGLPDQIKFTILRTPETLWIPLQAHRDDVLQDWQIECIPFADWIRIRLGETDPTVARPNDGR
jgi:hypothetical protein